MRRQTGVQGVYFSGECNKRIIFEVEFDIYGTTINMNIIVFNGTYRFHNNANSMLKNLMKKKFVQEIDEEYMFCIKEVIEKTNCWLEELDLPKIESLEEI